MSKRKRQSSTENESDAEIDKSWISATATRNYMLKDPLMDWLNLYGTSKGFVKDSESETELQKKLNFTKYIMNKGNEFEHHIMKQLKDKHKDNFVTVDNKPLWPIQKKYNHQIEETISLMEKGTNIIYQGLVYNHANKTFGYPDLIVRSDYLNNLVNGKVITSEKSKKGCKFSKDWHYRIIDIKFTTLKLKVNESNLLNQGSILPYKAQTYIYNEALGYMQYFVPGKAYLLGRGWSSSNNDVRDPFDKLAQIDFFGEDQEIKEDVGAAIEWIKDVRKNGDKWEMGIDGTKGGATRQELYPNMCNDMDYDWHKTKSIIASNLSEITSVWQCGLKNREISHCNNIYKWTDNKCSSKTLGIGGKVIPVIVDKILETNRGENKYSVNIDTLRTSLSSWMNKNSSPSFFIDFETVSNVNNVESSIDTGIIFMIGSGRTIQEESESKWDFTSFTTNNLSLSEEKRILILFVNYLKEIANSYGSDTCRLYHFSYAEQVHFSKALIRHDIVPEIKIEWIDLLKVVKDNNFIVKGALDFSLKSIVSALSFHKMIDIDYSDSDVCNGSQAMVAAFLANEATQKNISMANIDMINCVRKYNEIDCLTLKSLLKILIDLTL